jgi:adenylosuccinate synthase
MIVRDGKGRIVNPLSHVYRAVIRHTGGKVGSVMIDGIKYTVSSK